MRIAHFLIIVSAIAGCGRSSSRPAARVDPAPRMTVDPMPAPVMLSGTISYPEKVVLAPSVVVRIQVIDRSPEAGKDSIVAYSELLPEGKQAPLAYAISVPRAALREGRTYVVHVRITEGRVLRFITKKAHLFDVAHLPSRFDIIVNAVPQRLW